MALEAGIKAGGARKKFVTNEVEFGSGISHDNLPNYIDASKQKAFVDFQNDVTEKDIMLAVREDLNPLNMSNATQLMAWPQIKEKPLISMLYR